MALNKKLPPILKRLDRQQSPPPPQQLPPVPPPSPPSIPLTPHPTHTLTPTPHYNSLTNFLGSHFTTRPVTAETLLHFFKSKLHHHPHLRHYDLHIFTWASTVDSFRHDHTTFEWMARSLASTNRISELTTLLQFIASNPCPCSEGFFRQGKIDDAVKMAHEMIDLGIEFSGVTCEILLDGLCKQGRNVEACELLIDFSRRGVVPYEFDLSTLVDSLCRRGFAGRALEVVYELWRNGKAPSLISSTTLVEGLRRSGKVEEAFRLMEKLLKESSIVPDVITFNCLIRDVCKARRTSDANELMLLGCSKGLQPDWMTYDVLVSGYTAEGKRKEGEGLVDEMLDRDFIPDLATYNTLMNGLSRSRGSVQKRT
ncbi:Pentatricopeptide repeat-containing protein At2g36240 [Linum perenne]